MSIEHKISRRLIAKKQTLSLAESCSGGLLSDKITNVPGCSQCFLGAVVCYANSAKIKLLNVQPNTLKKYGAVSKPSAQEMAFGVQKLFQTDYAIAVTGIAGPTGASFKKPLGLTFIAVANKTKIHCFKFVFAGTRRAVKSQAARKALEILFSLLKTS